jgi:hypothetical protein
LFFRLQGGLFEATLAIALTMPEHSLNGMSVGTVNDLAKGLFTPPYCAILNELQAGGVGTYTMTLIVNDMNDARVANPVLTPK